ncbi:glucose-6-phosphate dehydrogenase [Zafaria cholistanensis]|uniref:glucose-6-phosphate dehydrogenase n=1 Tax=Zafaria cholistanensis TaxID=1682741 RepID=UPI001CED6577|nr:glucose-6-phosphate dehydrogenase [Zafaria cholistanensis]
MAAAQNRRVKTLLILGASGDLTGRLLLPGLAGLVGTGRVPGLVLVGADAAGSGEGAWRDRVERVFAEAGQAADDAGRGHLAAVAAATRYRAGDVTRPGVLANMLAELEGPTAVYFALPPAVTEAACAVLAPEEVPEGTTLVLEKPFGSSAESARELNRTLARLVPEPNIQRIDHFLGKATVLNILGLRFANRLLEPLLGREHVAQVEIVYDEDLALEGRAGYYDRSGTLRDMIQSHLLHVLALLAMDAPASLGERDLRDRIAEALRAASVPGDFARTTRRARYTAGRSQGRPVPDYAAEAGVDGFRGTETLAEIEVRVGNGRWAGVPFILRSGKALGRRRKEAVITFRPVDHLPEGFRGHDSPTRLRIGFGPDTLALELDINGPGDPYTLDRVDLRADLNSPNLLPYGEVLLGVLSGDPTLSVRADTAEDCWRIVEPVLAAWAAGEVPLEEYPAGSGGPAGWASPPPPQS